MIIGAHSIIYSKKPDLDRSFLSDVIGLSSVDVGGGWLIFGLPPSELAIHPADKNGGHELFFMVKDIEKFVATMKEKKIKCSPIRDLRWGILTQITLPGGGKLGVYQPRHARPKSKANRKAKKS